MTPGRHRQPQSCVQANTVREGRIIGAPVNHKFTVKAGQNAETASLKVVARERTCDDSQSKIEQAANAPALQELKIPRVREHA